MAAINTVVLVGRLTQDLELKTVANGSVVAPFTLAVAGQAKDSEANFIDCVAWGSAAETMKKYLDKGDRLGITGRLSTRTYEKDGIKRKVTEVVIIQFMFLNSKPAATSEASGGDTLPSDDDIDQPINLDNIPF